MFSFCLICVTRWNPLHHNECVSKKAAEIMGSLENQQTSCFLASSIICKMISTVFFYVNAISAQTVPKQWSRRSFKLTFALYRKTPQLWKWSNASLLFLLKLQFIMCRDLQPFFVECNGKYELHFRWKHINLIRVLFQCQQKVYKKKPTTTAKEKRISTIQINSKCKSPEAFEYERKAKWMQTQQMK